MRFGCPVVATGYDALCIMFCRELAQQEACPVVATGPHAFAVDVRAATAALRQKHTEAVVRDRFPPLGARCRATGPVARSRCAWCRCDNREWRCCLWCAHCSIRSCCGVLPGQVAERADQHGGP